MIPPLLCVSLPGSDRRTRLAARLGAHHVPFSFVNAVREGSPEEALYRSPRLAHDKHVACFISHLRAVRQFYETHAPWGLIGEDDLVLHKEFGPRYESVMRNVPDGTPLVTFCAMVEDWSNSPWAGRDPGQKNLVRIDPDKLWGTVLYGLSHEYAGRALERFDRSFDALPLVTSEVIVRQSEGLLSYPLLAIEEGLDSDRGDPAALPYHRAHFEAWGLEHYG